MDCNSGNLYDNENYAATDYIYVVEGNTYSMPSCRMLACYDQNKKYIFGIDYPKDVEKEKSVIIPNGCKYMRLSFYKTHAETYIFTCSTKLRVKSIGFGYYTYLYSKPGTEQKTLLPDNYYIFSKDSKSKDYSMFFDNITFGSANVSDNKVGQVDNKRWYISSGELNENKAVELFVSENGIQTIKKVNIVPVSASQNDRPIRLLAIGDSITKNGYYLYSLKSSLSFAALGTRDTDYNGISAEGRGGWTMGMYFNNADSPFVFPVNVSPEKYFGDTVFWKKVCYDDPEGYFYKGFQKLAMSDNQELIYNDKGYLKNPNNGDVIHDSSKPSGERFQIFSSATNQWEIMNPQPVTEMNFNSYLLKHKNKLLAEGYPTHVVLFLGTNDFMGAFSDNIYTRYRDYLDNFLTQIVNNNMKVIVCTPPLGGFKGSNSETTPQKFSENMKEFIKSLLSDYDTENMRNSGVYIAPLHLNVDRVGSYPNNDFIHPTNELGHVQIADVIAGVLQYCR